MAPTTSDTTFIGVDLAWQGNSNHTGVAIAQATEAGAVLTAISDGITSFDAVAEFVVRHATENTVVAIDAPLVIKNVTGRRNCESLISRKFGARHASAHSSNLTLYPGGGPTELVSLLGRHGFAHDVNLETARRRNGRWIFEVYPHPAQVVLFHRDRIIRYKKGSVAQRRAGLETLRYYLTEMLREGLPAIEPGEVGLALSTQPLEDLHGLSLKRYEDLLDSWFCAYLALYVWWWGIERNEMLGDLDSGYIIVPTQPLEFRRTADATKAG